MNKIIDIKDLSFSYSEDSPILEDLNMDIYQDKITAIFGDSGVGKSTILNILSLMFRELDSYKISGEVWFNGEDILKIKKDFWKVRREIVYISQQPNPFNNSILKNLQYPLKINGVKDKNLIAEKVEKVLKDVNLFNEVKDRLNSSALELSGGQQQKLCFARALILNPKILLMDEPTSSLDSRNIGIINQLIVELGRRNSIIFVSHDRDQINRIADHGFECRDRSLVRVF